MGLAGLYIMLPTLLYRGQSYDVTVGVGGAGGPAGGGSYQSDNRGGENGANSTFASINGYWWRRWFSSSGI